MVLYDNHLKEAIGVYQFPMKLRFLSPYVILCVYFLMCSQTVNEGGRATHRTNRSTPEAAAMYERGKWGNIY